MTDEEDKGFKVSDRRIFAEGADRTEEEKPAEDKKPEETAEAAGEAAPEPVTAEEESAPPEEEIPPPGVGTGPPPVNFTNFVMELVAFVYISLGEIPDPNTQQPSVNLDSAKHYIDILEMLGEKTSGNLEPQEENLLKNLLTELQLRYVKAAG